MSAALPVPLPACRCFEAQPLLPNQHLHENHPAHHVVKKSIGGHFKPHQTFLVASASLPETPCGLCCLRAGAGCQRQQNHGYRAAAGRQLAGVRPHKEARRARHTGLAEDRAPGQTAGGTGNGERSHQSADENPARQLLPLSPPHLRAGLHSARGPGLPDHASNPDQTRSPARKRVHHCRCARKTGLPCPASSTRAEQSSTSSWTVRACPWRWKPKKCVPS